MITIAILQLYAHLVAMARVINTGIGPSKFESTCVEYMYIRNSSSTSTSTPPEIKRYTYVGTVKCVFKNCQYF